MFPDPSSVWRSFPTIMDGMRPGIFVLDRGLWRGVLRLVVLEDLPGSRAYGVEIKCVAYAAYEDALYSCADHGGDGLSYDGAVFVKEATKSALLASYETVLPWMGKPRHFAFVGTDFCYETLGFEAPVVRVFAGRDEAYEWPPASGQD